MKIRISREDLSSELAKLQGVVSQRSTLAILSNALLDASGDRLTLHATDLDISMSTSCPCEVIEPGKLTIHAKNLFDIVKNLEDGEISIETEDNHYAKLNAGSVSCRIVGTHPDDFPQMLETGNIEMYPISTDRLLDMIDKTIFSVSTDDARPNLTGAFFRLTDANTLLMVSTDGHRLSKIEQKPGAFEASGSTPKPLRDGIIIPRKGLTELKRVVDTKGPELSFGLKDNNIVFKHGALSLAIRLIDGSFPDFTQVLPKESDRKAVVDKDAFQQALRFVSLFSNPKTHNVRLSLNENGLELYATDPDRGEGLKTVPVEYGGTPVKAGYNFKYLLDVLSVIDGDEVSVEIIDTLSPTLVRDTTREEMLFVVMPMRL
jgi:DNA polymerase-3 subunit beta